VQTNKKKGRAAMAEPRRSASVVLLRQRPTDRLFQVLMAQRSQAMKSFSGVFVFPGGVTEQSDGPALSREASKRCGLRELFEECGVLLAREADGSVRAHHMAPQVRFFLFALVGRRELTHGRGNIGGWTQSTRTRTRSRRL